MPPSVDLSKLLHKAASNGHAKLVALLVEKGADPKCTDKSSSLSYSALHNAVNCRNHKNGIETMKVLLEKAPSLVSIQSPVRLITPLHLAVTSYSNESKKMYHRKVQLLIDAHANINAKDSDGNTPLHEIASGCNLGLEPPDIDVIEMLVKAGAQLAIKNKEGKTPFQIAQEKHSKWIQQPEIQSRLTALTK